MTVTHPPDAPTPDENVGPPIPIAGLLIDGLRCAGTGALLVITSRLDGSSRGQIASADGDDVRLAYDAAERALPKWSTASAAARGELMQRAATMFRLRANEIGSIISADMGKPISEAITEVNKGAAVLDYYAQAGYRSLGDAYLTDTGEEVVTYAVPLGVVALITPWNFPFTLPIRKIAAAIATGNTVVFKPASNSALSGLAIGDVLVECGVPAGVVNVVVGQSAVIESALFTDSRLGGVSLTGSYPTAAAIRRLLPLEVPFQAELGGKNALVIWRDAPIEQAVDIVIGSAFNNNGQICTSAGRVLVHRDIADELLAALGEALTKRPFSAPGGEYGILSSERERAQIEDVLDRNASAVRQVVASPWPAERFPPTVLVEPATGELTDEEIFGPVITYEIVVDLDEAIASANATRYGLTAGIVTRDLAVAQSFWRASTAGTVKINAPLTGTPYHIPLEGWGESGAGAGEGGIASLQFFTKRKAVHLRMPKPS